MALPDASPQTLFDVHTLRKLERLALVASQVRAGVMKGERRSTRRGTSIEFADYRNYTRGDDLRRIDWNVFARLERPFIKLLEEEEDLAVHVLIDASASMNWPHSDLASAQQLSQPTTGQSAHLSAQHKFTFARRVAAGLGHVALGSGDRLTLTALRSTGNATWGPHRGKGFTLDLLNFLTRLPTAGTTQLNSALRNYGANGSRSGLCMILSDLMSPGGWQDGVTALQARGYEVTLIHLLAPDEVNPPLAGDLRLIDSETGEGQDVTIDANLRDQYAQRLLAWREEIGTYCARRGIHYATVETSTPWEELILYELRRMGVVR